VVLEGLLFRDRGAGRSACRRGRDQHAGAADRHGRDGPGRHACRGRARSRDRDDRPAHGADPVVRVQLHRRRTSGRTARARARAAAADGTPTGTFRLAAFGPGGRWRQRSH
jgi:hypothetical protein